MKPFFLFLLVLIAPFAGAQQNTRPLLDIVDVQGVRDNQLVGYGLVVGLAGTGDQSQVKFTSHSMRNMLEQFGVNLDSNINPKLKNVAAVAVHAVIPAQASAGQTIDITVSSLGDAKSLRGGSLLVTPLQGVDGQIYAVAQGSLVVGGISAEGRDGTSVTINTPTVGTIPNGAIVERGIPSSFNSAEEVVLNLKRQSFTTARNIERAINASFGPNVARADSNAKVLVRAPAEPRQRVTFMSMLESIEVESGRTPARVVFNSRTGTVVMGADVKISRAAVSHGNLSVAISEVPFISQPGQLSNGTTEVGSNTSIDIDQAQATSFILPEGTSLEVIVNAINSLGATPADLMVILQALDEAGALNAELVVI
ncbi:flagellar basal body P-ring protein FlgI [Ferrimonas lipolytica]|uniref:Flagellar P-ring protein n=1 Tax=Ferrimonas lipolytica TaxID=2724191 RepID=A0A6H1UEL7_9GAMM|nr:flagellar basal body P-ring protein FlgI [Ferrimonas lipolytica]QIZ76783.1 flagellar basal body P-ring protein FlgI [Ferrimonas lipolytica]